MAFFDWNGNGKKDIMDDFIEYKSYEEFTKNKNNSSYSHNNYSNNTGCGVWGWICIIFMVLGLIYTVVIILLLCPIIGNIF